LRYTGFGANGSKVIVYRDYIANGDGRPLISNDSATSFALAACDPHTTFTGDATSHSDSAVYDAGSDTLYVAMSGTSSTYSVLKLTPVSDAGEWSNVTFNIATGSFADGNLSTVPLA
jgi:hypothetical protein